LLRFTAEDEALFVLDEPDTHLNPAWCLDYLDNLRRYGADLATSQIIMTTHSPMTFAGLERDEVVVMRRVDNKIVAERPTAAPKGMGFGAILTSELFGLRSTLDKDTLKDVERLRFLAAMPIRNPDDEAELARLNEDLSQLGFSREFRDPLFKEFVAEMAKSRTSNSDLWGQVLTSDQRQRRAAVVSEAAKRIRQRREAE
jgi:ABC-type multidrug transport system ATPase subunit